MRAALFVTCLVDLMRPRIGWAALTVLEAAGVEVVVPAGQSCCGQPARNSGDRTRAARLARMTIAALEGHDTVIVPSGSCAATLRDYPDLLADDPEWACRAKALAERSWEILAFLDEVLGWRPEGIALAASATYHDSCSGLRELGIEAQPRRLLAAVEGLALRPLPGAQTCCGFGGTFCVKYPAISDAIVAEKARAIAGTGADLLLSGDLGCLMNMAGKLHREGATTRAFHTLEVLAGMATPGTAIGETGA